LLEENVHFILLEGLECDRSLNFIHFIALWPNFHNFFLFCYTFVLEKVQKSIKIVPFKWAPLAPFFVYLSLDFTQFDVCTAFLHRMLDEEIYMTQLPYFEDVTDPHHVYRFLKSLYGLRQASRVWNRHFTQFLAKHNLVATD
jgi:hypothetical protein